MMSYSALISHAISLQEQSARNSPPQSSRLELLDQGTASRAIITIYFLFMQQYFILFSTVAIDLGETR